LFRRFQLGENRELAHNGPLSSAVHRGRSPPLADEACTLEDGFIIFDISDPSNRVEVSHPYSYGSVWNIAIADNHAYVADGHSGLTVFDISNRSDPFIAGRYNPWGIDCASEVTLSGKYAYIATSRDIIMPSTIIMVATTKLYSLNTKPGGG